MQTIFSGLFSGPSRPRCIQRLSVASGREQLLARIPVAQSCTLLYRRLAVGWVPDVAGRVGLAGARQITNLRYGRVQPCATRAAIADLWRHGPGPVVGAIGKGTAYGPHPVAQSCSRPSVGYSQTHDFRDRQRPRRDYFPGTCPSKVHSRQPRTPSWPSCCGASAVRFCSGPSFWPRSSRVTK